jgi:hypothetical protein
VEEKGKKNLGKRGRDGMRAASRSPGVRCRRRERLEESWVGLRVEQRRVMGGK